MNKTQNYNLNQWEKSDKVLMDDFNADNAKIDAALKGEAGARAAGDAALQAALSAKGNCRIRTVTRVGDGDINKPATVTFHEKPLLVMAGLGTSIFLAYYGVGYGTFLHGSDSGINLITWSGNSMSMEGRDANTQCNVKGAQYTFVYLVDPNA